jgi:hypothetical protein
MHGAPFGATTTTAHVGGHGALGRRASLSRRASPGTAQAATHGRSRDARDKGKERMSIDDAPRAQDVDRALLASHASFNSVQANTLVTIPLTQHVVVDDKLLELVVRDADATSMRASRRAADDATFGNLLTDSLTAALDLERDVRDGDLRSTRNVPWYRGDARQPPWPADGPHELWVAHGLPICLRAVGVAQVEMIIELGKRSLLSMASLVGAASTVAFLVRHNPHLARARRLEILYDVLFSVASHRIARGPHTAVGRETAPAALPFMAHPTVAIITALHVQRVCRAFSRFPFHPLLSFSPSHLALCCGCAPAFFVLCGVFLISSPKTVLCCLSLMSFWFSV